MAKYRIVHYDSGYAIKQLIPEQIKKVRKYLLFGPKVEQVITEYWSFIIQYDYTGRYNVCKFATVQEVENWILGLINEIVKEIEI